MLFFKSLKSVEDCMDSFHVTISIPLDCKGNQHAGPVTLWACTPVLYSKQTIKNYFCHTALKKAVLSYAQTTLNFPPGTKQSLQ